MVRNDRIKANGQIAYESVVFFSESDPPGGDRTLVREIERLQSRTQ
jgi:hypothetical protein